MRLYDLEYERWMRDPRISEAVDNCELSTLYQWLWETMKNDYAHASGVEGRRFESYRSDQKPGWDPSMAKKEDKVYTGTEIIGIAQMHKSNAVPVRGKKAAVEVATMRRG